MSTTKGHKKTRRIRAKELYLRKNAPPKPLPWYLHKKPHPELMKMLTDHDNLYRMQEIADFMFDLMMSKPALSPLEERLQEISESNVRQEKERFAQARFPHVAESVLRELGLPVPAKKHLAYDGAESGREEVKRVLMDVLATPQPGLPAMALDYEAKAAPPALSFDDAPAAAAAALRPTTQRHHQHQPTRFVPDAASLELRADDLQLKINEKVQISWMQELESHKTESAASLQSIFDAKKELGLTPHVSIGVRMVNAYLREGDADRAWDSFNSFHKYEHSSLDLYLAGMRVLGKKHNPTRAMSLFEQAEDVFPRTDLPYLYHATMRACKPVRQSTWYTFELYNRMTKVDSLQPTTETLSIVLETCAALGDVQRAKLMWHEMVDTYGVVPDEYAHCTMLNTLARGNRMLRSRSLKAKSVKVVNFQDKALLATCGGFINAPIKFTDEVKDVLHELKGFSPDPTNYQSDYDRYRQLQEEAEAREEDEEEGGSSPFEQALWEEEEKEEKEVEAEAADEEEETATMQGKPPPVKARDPFLLPGETEEDFMGEDDDDDDEDDAQAKKQQRGGRRARRMQAKSAEGVDGKAAAAEGDDDEQEENGGVVGNEHCVFIPGLSPETPGSITGGGGGSVGTSGLHVKNTYAKLFELGQVESPSCDDAALSTTTTSSSSLPASSRPITGTTNGERQEANIQLANQFLSDITTKYDQPMTTEILNAHVKVFASALRLHRAQECLVLYDAHGVQKDVYTYNTLISMFCRAQRLPKAFEYFSRMQSEGVAINRMTVGPLIDALARNGRVDEAVDMYLEYKNLNLLEKHVRYVRNRLRMMQDPRAEEFPDPNFWRSAENMSTQLHKLNRSKEGMFKQQWIQSMIRS